MDPNQQPRRAAPLWRRLLVALSVALALAPEARAQGGRTADPTVRVFLRNSTVRVGEAAQLFVEVDGADRVQVVAPPKAAGLEFEPMAGPARRESYVFANGRQQRSVRETFSTSARPTQAGTYEISPLRLNVDGVEVTAPAEPLVLKVVADLDASNLLVFERLALPTHVYEGEPYDVDLRFGWDASLREASVELSLPWWNGQDGVLEVAAPVGSSRGQAGVFVNRGRRPHAADYLGTEDRNGQSFQLMRLSRRYIATRAGTLTFGQAVFEFSQLLRAGNVFEAAATREFYATLPAVELEVRPIPEAGRPFEWTGAVGRLTADRAVDRRDVDVGDSVKLQVTWTGHGNLEFFEAPDLSRVAGFETFRVLGVDDDRDADRRRIVYDIVPLRSGDQEIPPVPLWVFDTESEGFVELRTEPLPLRVRKVDGADDPFANLGTDEPAEAALDLVDIDATPRRAADLRGPSGRWAFGALAGLLIAWPFARAAVRRAGDPDSREARRRRGARRALVRALGSGVSPEAAAAALAEYLGAKTSEPAEAWVGRDPVRWRRARGETRGLAGEDAFRALDGLLVELDRARFAREGGAARVDPARVLAVVDGLRGELR